MTTTYTKGPWRNLDDSQSPEKRSQPRLTTIPNGVGLLPEPGALENLGSQVLLDGPPGISYNLPQQLDAQRATTARSRREPSPLSSSNRPGDPVKGSIVDGSGAWASRLPGAVGTMATNMRQVILATVALGGLGLSGCAMMPDARYVYQDGQFGVIGIPQNTKFGRKDFLAQAHDLMRQHFPDGYEIVRSEEVIEGQRSLDSGKKTEIASEPSFKALDQMIKLGRFAETRSIEQKDSIPILESRIIYRRKTTDGPQGANGFAALASATPQYYIDPNDMARCRALKLLADAKQAPIDEKTVEKAVVKVSTESITPGTATTEPAKGKDHDAECLQCKSRHP